MPLWFKTIATRIAAFAVVVAFLAAANVALAAERILDFNSFIEIHADSTMTVTETIRVVAEGREIRRGIVREFPTVYRGRRGNTVTVDFAVEAVQRDGDPEPFFVEDQANGKAVYIGRREVQLRPGAYTYTIRYRTDRQLGFFDEFDELYWNVTGTGWIFPIDRARAEIVLPPGAKPVQHAGYTGPQDATGRDYAMRIAENGHVVFTTTRALPAKSGLTVAVAWPKGFVQPPTLQQRIDYFLRDHGRDLVAGGAALLVALYFLAAWVIGGRDPARGTIIPLFEPPEGLHPAAARFVRRMGFDGKAFAAAVVDLAVQRRLRIEEAMGIYRLRRTGARDGGGLPAAEAAMFDRLLGGLDDSIDLVDDNHLRIGGARDALQERLKAEYESILFKTNALLWLLGLVLSVLAVAGIVAVEPGIIAMIAAIVVIVGLNGLFLWLLKAPTPEGRKVMDAIEGFRMFLRAAEQPRLAVLHPPDKTPELFEKYLPYALALDVEQEWAEQFSGVLGAAGTDAYAPDWYSGDSRNFRADRIADRLGGSFASSIASASTPPGSSGGGGSSGSSGGGSSGGGGGGGGGRGW